LSNGGQPLPLPAPRPRSFERAHRRKLGSELLVGLAPSAAGRNTKVNRINPAHWLSFALS